MKYEIYPFKMEKQYRKRNWDYSKNGYYFVTICAEGHKNIFRNVSQKHVGTDPCICSSNNSICSSNTKKIVADINIVGKMITKWWLKIPEKFDGVTLDKFMVMPNHFHGILIINKVGNNNVIMNKIENQKIQKYVKEQIHGSVPTRENNTANVKILNHNIFGNVGLLGQTIQWFKIMSTNEYIKNVKDKNWPRFQKRLWQTRFHDRIIKSEKGFWASRKYIQDNPENWGKDKFNIFN